MHQQLFELLNKDGLRDVTQKSQQSRVCNAVVDSSKLFMLLFPRRLSYIYGKRSVIVYSMHVTLSLYIPIKKEWS